MLPSANDVFLRLPVRAQELALSLYGRRVRAQRYGGRHAEVLARLLESERWSPDRIGEMQDRRLREVLSNAARYVPFYRHRVPDSRTPADAVNDLRRIEPITKDAIRAAGPDCVSRQYHVDRLSVIHTGGTTGSPLSVYCDAAAIQTNYAFFERFRRSAGVGSGCRVATFAGRVFMRADAGPPFSRLNSAFNAKLFSSYHLAERNLPFYVDELARWSPELIDSYPSSIAPIARFLLRSGDDRIRPQALITSSETLDAPTRDLLTRAFGCPVFDHYGAAEMAALVTQCELGTYHANPEFGVLELLVGDRPAGAGEEGEIVATGFVNDAMPFVRYRTGDRAAFSSTNCACGRAWPSLAYIGGRIDDVIVTPDGRQIGRLDPVFKVASALFETRIVQDGFDSLRLEFASAEDIPDTDIAAVVAALRARVGDGMRIEVRRLRVLERTQSGKLRGVVNEWQAPPRTPERATN